MPENTHLDLTLFNTLGRQKQIFKPLLAGKAGLYTCGPTVYNFAHIGNLRTYIFEDILKRVLTYNGYSVNHVMNITDVGHLTSDADEGEDKMEKGSAREGKSAWDIAQFYTAAFQKNLADLNIIEPNTWCKATDHIPEQIALIEKLEQKGYTYQTTDGVYFDTSKLSDYGKLAQLDSKNLQAGIRVDLGEKKNPTDFALWKVSLPLLPEEGLGVVGASKRQMEWPSPWGIGFPGWHIECSAMAAKYLGQPFDIHCGGIDHIPVHHTNEIAQSEAAEGKPLANYWLHGEFLLINQDKMSKSGDNFITLETIKDRGINPLAYRYFLLQAHYRKQLSFSWEALKAAERGLNRIYSQVADLGDGFKTNPKVNEAYKNIFIEKINDDLNMPQALAVFEEVLKSNLHNHDKYETILDFDQVLGLGLGKIKKHAKLEIELPEKINTLIEQRDKARTSKNWPESDRLRQEIENLGYEVEDTKEGTKVHIK